MEPKSGENMEACSVAQCSGHISVVVAKHKGENHSLPLGQRHVGQPETSAHFAAALDLRARQQPLLDATSSFLPRGFQKGEIFPHFVERLSCVDEAAPLFFRNYQVPARKGQDASASHAPPNVGSTTPREQPGQPWRALGHRCHEECARECRYILSHAGWLDASWNVIFYSVSGPTAVDARSRRRTLRQSPFHWRGGAWPVLLGTASANPLAASRLF